ncbi:hypothetical protein ACOMHN_052519 [Nucella lapillus]
MATTSGRRNDGGTGSGQMTCRLFEDFLSAQTYAHACTHCARAVFRMRLERHTPSTARSRPAVKGCRLNLNLKQCSRNKKRRKASHSCLQCQQRYCFPCSKVHSSFRACYGHTVISLLGEDEGRRRGATLPSDAPRYCPKHPDQRAKIRCIQCKVSLCLKCDPNLHTELQEDKRRAEACFRARADTLHQWVKQSLEEAESSLQSASEQLARPWLDIWQKLLGRKRAVEAHQEHLLHVAAHGWDGDYTPLLSQASSFPEEDGTLTRVRAELVMHQRTFCVKDTPDAINPEQISRFLGVLGPPQYSPDILESVGMSCRVHTGDKLPLSNAQGKKKRRIRERMLRHNRLWVLYRPSESSPVRLKLFDADCQVVRTFKNPMISAGLVAVTEDVVLSCQKPHDQCRTGGCH